MAKITAIRPFWGAKYAKFSPICGLFEGILKKNERKWYKNGRKMKKIEEKLKKNEEKWEKNGPN
jgi:hypothetical protein